MCKKTVIILICIIIFAFAQLSVRGEDLSENKITYNEAWNLVKNAYELYMNLCGKGARSFPSNLNENLICAGDKSVLKTVDDAREYARTIYVNEIADFALLYSRYRDVQYLKRDENGIVIPLSGDFPAVKITELYCGFAMGQCFFSINKSIYDSYYGGFGSDFPEAEEVDFSELYNGEGEAGFSLIVLEASQGELSELSTRIPGRVKVEYVHTSNGWRIRDCGFFAGLLDGRHGINIKEESGFEPVFNMDSLSVGVWCTPGYENGEPLDVSKSKIPMRETEEFKTMKYRVIKKAYHISTPGHAAKDEVVWVAVDWYEVFDESTGKWENPLIDAVFRYQYKDQSPEEFKANGPIVTAVLVGGELYNLLNGAETFTPYTGPVIMLQPVDAGPAPYTGDGILKTLCAYSAVALLCLSACVISKRKRLKTPL